MMLTTRRMKKLMMNPLMSLGNDEMDVLEMVVVVVVGLECLNYSDYFVVVDYNDL